ncbi:30S ribosomal protein S17 [Candidatus Desantisbacteria bacterium]|nr:30S ribosomal protein S17 [Candidatus Desantisbacteria bacterium]
MQDRGRRKVREGDVISSKMDKTVVVNVVSRKKHPVYEKIISVKKSYYAHDEENTCKTGDRVRIMETRPLSKTKRWRVTEIVRKAV